MESENKNVKESGGDAAEARSKSEAIRSFALIAVSGAVAGAGFNLALGSVPWNTEGILGGLVCGVLIYAFS